MIVVSFTGCLNGSGEPTPDDECQICGKPRGRYARVAFELALRNLELVTPAPYDRSRSWTTTLLILLHPMDSETQYEPPNATALSPAGTQPR